MIHSFLDTLAPVESDDEDDDRPDIEFRFAARAAVAAAGPDVTPDQCTALILCGPGAATAFASCVFKLVPRAWSLDAVKETVVRAFPPAPRSPRFCTMQGAGSGPLAVVLLEGQVPADMSPAWCEALLAAFPGAGEVIMMDRVFRTGWRTACGQERPQEPHLCGLWTAAWGAEGPLGREGALPLLPAPNAVEGLAAALLTTSEASRRRCVVALGLQDGVHMGEGSLRAFERLGPLFSRLGVMPEERPGQGYREALRQAVQPASLSIYA